MRPVYRSNLFMLIIIIAQVLGSIFLSRPLQKFFSYNQFLVVTQVLFLLIPVLLYLLVTGLPIKETLKLNKIKLEDITIIIIIAFVSQPIASFLSVISGLFFENIVSEVLERIGSISYVTQLGIIALTPAICEEITMRGVILSGYEGITRAKAAIATGLLFGILHMNPQQFFYTFVLGILFAYLVRITNSIFSTMICHFTFNGIQVTMAYVITKLRPEGINESDNFASHSLSENFVTLMPLLLWALACTYIVIYLVKKLERRNNIRSMEYVKGFVTREDDVYLDENMAHLPRRNRYYDIEERVFNGPYIAIIVIYIVLMIVTEVVSSR